MIWMGWLHGHSSVEVRFHLCRVPTVFPTLARALLRDTQSFLCRSVPDSCCSFGVWWPRSGDHPIRSRLGVG